MILIDLSYGPSTFWTFEGLKPNIKKTKIVKLANKGESAKKVKIGALILEELKTRPK